MPVRAAPCEAGMTGLSKPTSSITLDVRHPGKGLPLGKGLPAASTAVQGLLPHCPPSWAARAFRKGVWVACPQPSATGRAL